MRPEALSAALLAALLAWPLSARAQNAEASTAAALAVPALGPVILDPGHGGRDLGAVVGGRMEKDIALAVSLKVKDRLESLYGVPARLTRDSDVFVPLDERVRESIADGGVVFVSLHLNQVRRKKARGITVYAFGRGRWKPRHRRSRQKLSPLSAPPREQARESADLAEEVTAALRARGFQASRPARARFYVLKNPEIPSILIELGYLSNPKEAAALASPAYQDALASAIAESLGAYAEGPAQRRPAQLVRRR
jgi:N-acetylmuramoyl-L-alanine amidase